MMKGNRGSVNPFKYFCALVSAVVLMACDGNSASYGLSERPSLGALDLPGANSSLGDYGLVDSFPQLSFDNPIFVAGVPSENRLVVVQQDGFFVAFDNDASVSTTRTILDISDKVRFEGEEGLLGLAFDPDFSQNRYFYVHYITLLSGQRHSVISRFSWQSDTDSATLASEKVILQVRQPYGNHNAGMLAFGPDDFLYIALGDGGSAGDPHNHGQNTQTLLGSLLRIDVHPANPDDAYDIPLDNPFVGEGGFAEEIYAYGLRNPFRFSFDRQTGDLWLGDVGQGQLEEVDLIKAGGNYGWRVFEGSQQFNDSANTLPLGAFSPPIVEYNHEVGVSVIGGYVYRGNAVPSLQGRYLYTDWLEGPVWALEYQGGEVVANEVIVETNGRSTSFGEGNDGEIYLLVGNRIHHFVELDGEGDSEPPSLLSETGIFKSLATMEVVEGFIEYDVNLALWSDNAIKRRWIAIPDDELIQFDPTAPWNFPQGSVLVKHFEMELLEGDPNSRRALETRILIHRQEGWQGFTYRWNEQGNDANLLTGREQEPITIELENGASRTQLYEYPSRTDCLACHTEAAGRVLGVTTRQINRDFNYPKRTDNQLRSWNHIGLFSQDIGSYLQYEQLPALEDTEQSVASRSRAYLEVNCAMCHQPGATSPVPLDLSYDTALENMGIVNVEPQAGDLGIDGAKLFVPADPSRSLLLQRMLTTGADRMPPLSSHLVDENATSVIGQWITSP